MKKPIGRREYNADSNGPSGDEYDLREENVDDLDSEYGEVTEEAMPTGFYKSSVRRQNCFFGISLMQIVAAFIGAYFLMDMSFTRSNVGLFGDEVFMEGSSGEVGIDALNAEVQEIVDEEITELEEAGGWGENAKKVEQSSPLHELISNRNKIGENSWTEAKQWWVENENHLDLSTMTKKEKRIANRFRQKEKAQKRKEEREKRIEDRKKNKNNNKGKGRIKGQGAAANATDLDMLTDKIARHYNFTRVNNKHGHKKGRGGGKNHRPNNKNTMSSGEN